MTLARKPAATSELPACDRAGPLPPLLSGASACFSAASFFACAQHMPGHATRQTSAASRATAWRHAECQLFS